MAVQTRPSCTAPVLGHRSAREASLCPACGTRNDGVAPAAVAAPVPSRPAEDFPPATEDETPINGLVIRFDEVMGAHIPVFASTGTALFPASARLRMRQGCFASEEEAREWAERVYPMLRDVAARHVKPRDTRPVCTVCEGRMVRSIYGARWECPRCPGVEIDHE